MINSLIDEANKIEIDIDKDNSIVCNMKIFKEKVNLYINKYTKNMLLGKKKRLFLEKFVCEM